jgi:hypothetical protein
MIRRWVPGFMITIFWMLAGLLLVAWQAPEETVNNRMRGILSALSVVYPLSLDTDRLQAPENRKQVLGALDEIAANADQLSHHAEPRSDGFTLISRSLAADAVNALQLFEAKNFSGARFHVDKMTNTCFACHSRLPGTSNPGLGRQMMDDPVILKLPPRDLMSVAVAARQFDTALDLGETLLSSEELSATALDLTGVIDDYLKIVIRVNRDLERAQQTLARFRERDDLPAYLGTYVDEWIQSLEEVDPHKGTGRTLSLARGLIQHGQVMNQYPADRRGLIQFMLASSVLHQLSETTPSTPENASLLAEVYYLLGLVETTLSRTSWTSETEFYLETAIRQDPKSGFARDAYMLLEEYLILGYTGSAGVNLPEEVETYLWELQDLIDRE